MFFPRELYRKYFDEDSVSLLCINIIVLYAGTLGSISQVGLWISHYMVRSLFPSISTNPAIYSISMSLKISSHISDSSSPQHFIHINSKQDANLDLLKLVVHWTNFSQGKTVSRLNKYLNCFWSNILTLLLSFKMLLNNHKWGITNCFKKRLSKSVKNILKTPAK